MRLGPKYVKALNRTAPYDLLRYGTETAVLAAPPEAEAVEHPIAPPPELSIEQVQALSEQERAEYKRQVVEHRQAVHAREAATKEQAQRQRVEPSTPLNPTKPGAGVLFGSPTGEIQ